VHEEVGLLSDEIQALLNQLVHVLLDVRVLMGECTQGKEEPERHEGALQHKWCHY